MPRRRIDHGATRVPDGPDGHRPVGADGARPRRGPVRPLRPLGGGEPGDTLRAVARRRDVPLAALRDLNRAVDPRALRIGSVLRLADTAGPDRGSGPDEGDAVPGDPGWHEYAYAPDYQGLWRGPEGTCGRTVGTWAFEPQRIRGNATTFDILRVGDAGEGLAFDVRRPATGERLRLTARPSGDGRGLTVNGPGIAMDLTRCGSVPDVTGAGDQRPDLTGRGDGPRYACQEGVIGTWRGQTAPAGARWALGTSQAAASPPTATPAGSRASTGTRTASA